METNNAERFGEALDQYEKALARRDFKSACDHLIGAIDCNPYPSLYEHLAKCLAVAREAYELELEAARPKGLFARMQSAMMAPPPRRRRTSDYGSAI